MISSSVATSLNPICFKCKAVDSFVWFKDKQNNVLCKSCFKAESEPVIKIESKIDHDTLGLDVEQKFHVNEKSLVKEVKVDSKEKQLNGLSDAVTSEASSQAINDVSIRKSSRNKNKLKPSSSQAKQGSSKGKGRRAIFKKCVSSLLT